MRRERRAARRAGSSQRRRSRRTRCSTARRLRPRRSAQYWPKVAKPMSRQRPGHLEDEGEVADEVVPAVAHGGELVEPGGERHGSGLVVEAVDRDRGGRDVLEVAPAPGLGLEGGLGGLEPAAAGAEAEGVLDGETFLAG